MNKLTLPPHLLSGIKFEREKSSMERVESFVALSDLLMAHEPTRIPLTRPADTLSPIGGEGDRFMERLPGLAITHAEPTP